MAQIKCLKCAYCLGKICDFCIRCNQCSDVRLCVECFLDGAEGGRHKRTHGYALEKIVPTNTDCLFDSLLPSESVWHFDEELKLLDAIETYGYGNWNEVSACIVSRSPLECMLHYERFYITGSIGLCTANTVCPGRGVIDHTNADLSVSPVLHNILPEDQHILGYMPYRDEFEYEHNNNAEKVLVAVPFGNIIDDLHRELQLNLVDIYNRHLEARFLRHSVAREHGLVTHLMRDLRSGQRKWRTGQTFRRIGGIRRRTDRRVFRRRSYKWSMVSRRRKPGRARWSTLAARRGKKRKERETESVDSPHFDTLLQLSHSENNPDELVTCDSKVQSVGVNESQLAILESAAPSNFQHLSKPRSRSFENLYAAGDELNPFDTEGTVCTTCLLSSSAVMGGRLVVPIRNKVNENFGSSALPFPYLTHCPHLLIGNGSASSDNADSGIGSGDSCAQSVSSTASLGTDPFVHTLSSLTRPAHISLRRPRSHSDSYEGNSVPTWSNSKSSDVLASLRQQSKPTSGNVAPALVARLPTSGRSRSKCSGSFVKHKNSKALRMESSTRLVEKRYPRTPPRSEVLKAKSVQLTVGSKKTACEANILDYPWLNPFVRFLNKTDANTLSENLSREEQLRSEIRQLLDHHKRGIYCMKDVHLQPTVRPVQNLNACTIDSNFTQDTHVKLRRPLIKRAKHMRSNPRTVTERLPRRYLNANGRRLKVAGHRGPGRPRLKGRKPGPGRPRAEPKTRVG